tara:strand:+ start:866 stop:1300 length:435 start_codon:yes stop_codon:yes gene_type:complete
VNNREQLQTLLAGCDNPYALLDAAYLPEDQARVLRTRNLRLIPGEKRRRGGKYAYAEWAHVIGIFQTLIGQHTGWRQDLRLLDAGCITLANTTASCTSTRQTLSTLLASQLDSNGLKVSAHYPGNWKEVPGAFFQDVLVLEKPR